MNKILFPALVLTLTACTPTLQGASARLAPSSVQLARGSSTEVSLSFVDRAGRGGIYTVSSLPMTNSGLTVTPLGSSIISGNGGTVRLKVSAAQTAELGKRTFEILLSGKEGKLQRTLTVNVTP